MGWDGIDEQGALVARPQGGLLSCWALETIQGGNERLGFFSGYRRRVSARLL